MFIFIIGASLIVRVRLALLEWLPLSYRTVDSFLDGREWPEVKSYRPYRVIRILDVKILGSGIFLGQHVDLMENRKIFDRTHHNHFRLKNILPWAKIGIFLLPNTVCS